MAINQNHLFEDLNGIKCAIVEKNASQARVDFLRPLLEHNGYAVVIVDSPAPKIAAVPQEELHIDVGISTTFTIGVTDVGFNAINAIFGRLLKTKEGRVVTLFYWQQKEEKSEDDIPYFESKK